MHHTFLIEAQKISKELANWYEEIGEKQFYFEGEDPLEHSSYNHVHLWKTESYLYDNPKLPINFHFRKAGVQYIFERWKARLNSYKSKLKIGYRLYVYEDRQPAVSIVAETPMGFPYRYHKDEVVLVSSYDEILRLYDEPKQVSKVYKYQPKDLLKIIEANQGSIGRSSAEQLGVSIGDLRKAIECYSIQQEVNRIRKNYKRTPAQFRQEFQPNVRFYEEKIMF
ncbi:MAG: hypothetical protein K0S74_353 [Chlamydiales bacterium]|jgi:hypothetical protein|nr:hypothetical protein [Chlamydiales bacterium]